MLIDCAVNAHSTTRQYDDVKVSIKSINNKNYFLFGISVLPLQNHLLAVVWCDIIKISVDFHYSDWRWKKKEQEFCECWLIVQWMLILLSANMMMYKSLYQKY